MRHTRNAVRSQSAMEFLMTYGWSILIVAVVLGALFQLGVFNSANLGPRAPTGNCKILRVAGMSNLEGTCSGVLPQEVAVFNGQSSQVNVGNGAGLHVSTFTLEAWIQANSDVSSYRTIVSKDTAMTNRNYWLELDQITGYLSLRFSVGGTANTFSSTTALNDNKWHEVVATYDGVHVTLYIDGVAVITPVAMTGTPDNPSAPALVGFEGTNIADFNGLISNVQIYNASLDANQVRALYLKGIGAAPIDPAHVAGWWPLNGDVNDYSGSNNNGAPTAISYTSAWTSGYTTP